MKRDDEQKEMTEMLQYVVKTVGTIDERVTAIDERVTAIDERVTVIEDNMVTKSEFNELSERVDLIDERTLTIYNILDRDAKQAEDNEMEIASAHHKLDRHEGWIRLLARKIGLELKA